MRVVIKDWDHREHFNVVIEGKLQIITCKAIAFIVPDPLAEIWNYKVEDFKAWWEDGVDFRTQDYALLSGEDTECILERLTELYQKEVIRSWRYTSPTKEK